ncbi:MAG TPA: hypothetical protein VFP35_00210 [Candidatus Saccharimonadales bacterium]|nr:hypothetical protein [Candidatus Saccharimonadales bacterium]
MDEPYKVFDVAKPRPSHTSRPIIVGHHPEMTDPMVRRPDGPISRPQPPAEPASTSTTIKVPINDSPPVHQAKDIPVTDEIREAIAKAHSPKVDVSILDQPAAATPADSTAPAVISSPGPIESASAPAPPAERDIISPEPVMPMAEPAVMPEQAEPIVSAEPHLQSLPVSHMPVTSPRRLKQVLIWLIVIIILAAIALYLLIDAGIISTNINLPFHLFKQ